jgi:hypothetical protein
MYEARGSCHPKFQQDVDDFLRLKRALTAVNLWCERWNININEAESREFYFCRRLRAPDDPLQLNGGDIPFVNRVACFNVTFKRRITGGTISRGQ